MHDALAAAETLAGQGVSAEVVDLFIGIAADQIINNAAKLRFMSGGRTTVPITVRTQVYERTGYRGHPLAGSLEAWFMHMPEPESDRAVDSPGRGRGC